ncbi:MAG TPA: oligopeptide/dipeptide ABC transporter ATP-binding protein [Blastocatellia bacterium]
MLATLITRGVDLKSEALLDVKNLTKYYTPTAGLLGRANGNGVKAVDGVSFTISAGETFGLVGESGCGKSTTGRCILRLIEPTAGEILFDGRDLVKLGRREMRDLRRQIQIIFQDPYSSLNPRMRVGDIVKEPLIIHGIGSKTQRRERVDELIGLVGLPADVTSRYPHEFSGGQRQRIGIARALALNPRLIVCDEPVSALDVSVQAQIVNLLQDLQSRLGVAYLFISHGLGIVRHLAHRVGIMYAGKLVEVGRSEEIFAHPLHPYTRLLLSAVLVPDPDNKRDRPAPRVDSQSYHMDSTGCSFCPRCPLAEPPCSQSEPELVEVEPGHLVACYVAAGEGGRR